MMRNHLKFGRKFPVFPMIKLSVLILKIISGRWEQKVHVGLVQKYFMITVKKYLEAPRDLRIRMEIDS